MSEEKRYQIAVSLILGVGDVIGKKLIAYCGSAEAVFDEGVKALNKIPERDLHIDRIVSLIDWSSSKGAQMLLQLEFKGVIIVLPGKMYKRVE